MPSVPLKLHDREHVSLNIATRPEKGKGPVGQLKRDQGQIPGVLYGHNQDPFHFKTDARKFEQILSKGGQNSTINVQYEDGQKSEEALIREVQYHKVRGEALHIDLLRIDPNETLKADVPLLAVGVPDGVRNGGGALQQTLTSIEVEAVVSAMPSAVEIDISSLVIGDSLHVSDLLDQENRITTDPARTIVNILAPRLAAAEEEEDESAESEESEMSEESESTEEE